MTDKKQRRGQYSAAALGGSIATIFWTVAAATFWEGVFSETAIAALAGATTTLLAFVFAFFFPDQISDILGRLFGSK